MNLIDNFMSFWNRLANRNQKIKFRNSREAAEFVRSISNKNKPNQHVMMMRRKYVAIQAERKAAQDSESRAGEYRVLRQRQARGEPV
ncbi:hypothetical protein SAMN06273572_101715 [Monaibacterium marinum]|uniref:Uncharacterized protein n=1 Tax=Pontivivens marinum TaxID=1690039 RepID=A0A2C9CNV2_9RHOB|nr:hypothetical protein SAMN06273572_101715 [Monaibacterium marinum]